MRFTAYLILFLIISSCISAEKIGIDNSLSATTKNNLIDLRRYIEPKWDNTYNFRHDRIQLPQNYKELVWKTELGEINKGNKADTVYLKYLIQVSLGSKLLSIILSCVYIADLQLFAMIKMPDIRYLTQN